MRKLLLLVLGLGVALPGALVSTATAAAPAAGPPGGRVVFVCGANLCAIDPSTGVQQQITADGAGYTTPDVTADGATVAADRGDNVVVGPYGTDLTAVSVDSRSVSDVAIAPDGSAVSESHSYVENEIGLCFPGPVICLELVAHNETSYTPAGSTAGILYDGGNGTTFSASGALLSGTYDVDTDTHAICRVDQPAVADQPCTELFEGPAPFTSPDVSPDGQLVAVTVTPEGVAPSVQIFGAAAGQGAPAPLRVVAQAAGSPTFSPDGSWLAYAADDGWIYAAPTAGGGPVRLAQGTSPAWGGASIEPGTASVDKPQGVVKVTKNKVRLKVSCRGDAACVGRVVIRVQGKAVTKPARYSVAAGVRTTVRARVTRKGTRWLPKGDVVKAIVVADRKTRIKLRR